MKKSKVYLKAYEFAKLIIAVYKDLITKNEYVMSRQLLKSATSVGANIAEANAAASKKDFSAKMSIAYKEITESIYWINLLQDTEFIDSKTKENIMPLANDISKMLCAIVRSTRKFEN